ncbi:hypothetical protein HD806DRAFT_61599 [Xylariaceae sp. AK1471]|nr:hypothetical protein HD806DRAFT_61599 [Xylariaceae sp. AK1471]
MPLSRHFGTLLLCLRIRRRGKDEMPEKIVCPDLGLPTPNLNSLRDVSLLDCCFLLYADQKSSKSSTAMTQLYPAETSSGVVTSFIPLTTVFTHSVDCSSYFRKNGPSLVAFDPGYGLDIDSNVRCVPSAVTTWWEQGLFGESNDEGHTAVSLGPLMCPDAWATVVSSIKNGISTHAMCCPFGYYLANGSPGSVGGDCLSDVTSGATLTFQSTRDGDPTDWAQATTKLSSKSVIGAIAIVGWNINRVPSSTTRSATSPPSSHPSSSSTALSSPKTTSDSIPSATAPPVANSSAASSSSLSSGTMAGIGVGVALGVIGIVSLLAAAFIMRRRKRRRTTVQQPHPPLQQNSQQQHLQPQQPWQVYELNHETPKAELESHQLGSQAGGILNPRPPAELYG